jgi:iron complex outermembrane recepter protein
MKPQKYYARVPKILLVLLISFFINFQFSFSQLSPGKISGVVADQLQKKIDGATVSLLNQDSILSKISITDSLGKFDFINLTPGKYYIEVTFVGFERYISPLVIISTTSKDIELPLIVLNIPDKGRLKEVVVTTKKAFVERRLDRIIVNPDALISNAGISVLDVMEKLPGVQVDVEGVITLQGKAGVSVFVDDKPTNLSSSDLANYLRGLSSSAIETIEIMKTPPSKYDAAGNGGIINIRLKKVKTKGLNAGISLNYGQGVYGKTVNNLNLNYKVNKLNLFANLGYGLNENFQDLIINRQYLTDFGSKDFSFNQSSFIKRDDKNINLRAGLDYSLSKKTIVGAVFSIFRNTSDRRINSNAEILNSQDILSGLNKAFIPSYSKLENKGFNVNLNHKFDSLGKEVLFNADYVKYDTRLNQSLLNTTMSSTGQVNGETTLLSNLPGDIDIRTMQVDYKQPFIGKGNLSIGSKLSYIKTGSEANFFDVISGIPVVNNIFTNNFKYKERVSAVYTSYNTSAGRISLQAGLRLEHTSIAGNQLGNALVRDSSFKRKYTNLFPTFYVEYRIDSLGKHLINCSFGKRIERPDYQDLNPFTYPIDNFTYYGGNPLLQPTFSTSFEISYTFNNIITTSFEYSVNTDLISETNEQRDNIYYSRPGNVGKWIQWGFSASANLNPFKWLRLQLYAESRNNEINANLYGQLLDRSRWYLYLAPVAIFQITKSLSAELSGTHVSRNLSGQFITIPVGQIRMGLSKKVLKDKGSIKLTLTDVFYTNRRGGEIIAIRNATANWRTNFDSRVVNLTFAWRFSKGQAIKGRTNNSSSEAEQNRIKSQ